MHCESIDNAWAWARGLSPEWTAGPPSLLQLDVYIFLTMFIVHGRSLECIAEYLKPGWQELSSETRRGRSYLKAGHDDTSMIIQLQFCKGSNFMR